MKLLKQFLLIKLILLLGMCISVRAEEYSVSQLVASQGTVLTTLVVDNLHGRKQQTRVNKRKLIAVLNTGNDNIIGSNLNFEAILKLIITAKDINGARVKEIGSIELKITNKKPENVCVIEYQSVETAASLEICVANSGYTVQPITESTFLNQHIKLRIELKDELGFGILEDNGDYIIPTKQEVWPCTGCTFDNLSKVTLKWDLPHGGSFQHFDSYDLEIMKVEPDKSGKVSVDWGKAASLEVTKNEYSMTLAGGTGFYLWRVRGVGSYYYGARGRKGILVDGVATLARG